MFPNKSDTKTSGELSGITVKDYGVVFVCVTKKSGLSFIV